MESNKSRIIDLLWHELQAARHVANTEYKILREQHENDGFLETDSAQYQKFLEAAQIFFHARNAYSLACETPAERVKIHCVYKGSGSKAGGIQLVSE